MTGPGARSRLLAGLCGSLMALSVTAAPAQAKSGISITAVPVGAAPGAANRIAVSAFGGDDAAGRQRLCVQRLVDGTWRVVLCGRAELGTGGWVRATVAARNAHGKPWFRAVLQRIGRHGHPQPIADLVSAPVSPAAASAPAPAAAPAVGSAVQASPEAAAGPVTGAGTDTDTGGDVDVDTAPALLVMFATPAGFGPGAAAECTQPQTASKSTVSLSSVDNGIATASVVRSK